VTPAVERLRTGVACLLLTALVFAQDAGRQVADTKLDLVVDPGGLLARALHLWDPEGGAGQLQNQAYGYLFPLGPLFWALQGAGLPDWAVQRAWQSLILCTALLGVRALAQRLGIGTPATRLLAGVAYALAARPVSQLGAISVEVWPYALAPWVLVPLVTGAQRGSPRRAAALSGLALLLVGGVNAAATLAVVPLGVLWLAVQSPGPRRRRLACWWACAVGCATAWWLGPLLLLGRYSPPFLDVIESAATTTRQTGLWSVLSGNDLWLQYLAIGRPARPAGFDLVTEPALVVCVTAVWALGLLGLLLRSTPHRGFLAGGVLLGVLVVGAGHTGALTGPLAGWERDLLDGALAPFRNVHKYDLLLRLPLALGLAAAAAAVRLPAPVRRRRAEAGPAPRALRPVAALAAVAVVGAASPALGSLHPEGSFTEVPGYWREAAAWLDERAERQAQGAAPARALVVPAAAFADQLWGRTGDEPLQPLAGSPWVVRDAVPLGGPGVTRVLDVVEEVLRSGRGSPALARYLARAGVRHLVVRNDLDLGRTGATRPLVVRAALAASPGLARVASFGPPVGTGFATGQLVVDSQLGAPYPAVEVFEVAASVPGAGEAVTTWAAEGALAVTGGPESVLALLEAELLDPGGSTRLAGEPDLDGDERAVLTDGYRDREVDLGRAADGASATLGAGTGRRLDRPVADHLPVTAEGTRATAVLHGITSASASSSAADADALLLRGRDHHPAAAFDGDPATTWATGGVLPVGQWVEAGFARTRLAAVELRTPVLEGAGATPTRVRVTTDGGSAEAVLEGGTTRVALDDVTTRLRVTLTQVRGGPGQLGVSALEARLLGADGPLLAQRGLRLAPAAGDPGRGVDAVLTAGRRTRPGCLLLADRPLCASSLPLGDEDDDAVDRVLALPSRALLDVEVRGRARGGPALDALLQQGQVVTATASSRAVGDPAARPAAVLDRDLRTAWVAAPTDPSPSLTVDLLAPQRITGVTVVVDPNLAASRPRSVGVSVDGGPVRTARLTAGGEGVVPAVRGSRVTVTFPDVEARTDLRLDGFPARLPVGLSELRLLGPARDVFQVLLPTDPLRLPCGQGPVVEVDGEPARDTRVEGTVGDALAGRDLRVVTCGPPGTPGASDPGAPLDLAAGEHRVRAARTDAVTVTSVVLTDRRRPAPTTTASRVRDVPEWGSGRRVVDVAPGAAAWLVVHEAHNPGWRATLDGAPLRAARLDGWQQGFRLPEAGGRVELVFEPDRPYLLSLVLGALLAVLLVGFALAPRRAAPLPGPVARRRRWPGTALAAGAVVVAGGVAGALALVGAAALRRRAPGALAPVGVGALATAGALVALDPWPGRALVEAPSQAACLVALAVLAVSLARPPAGRPARGPAGASPAPPPPAATPTPRAR
jgi:arabinofuranan 3-O-arabinosyltransferase